MPFTFSHPAAVLPLTCLPRRWFSLTGLVVGSLTPDFEYFLRMRVYSTFSHSWTGVFYFDLPLAIILASIFHLVVRDQLIDSLPNSVQGRLIIFKRFKWKSYLKKNMLIVLVSCIVGVMTHILWDSFTHQHGHFVQIISSIQQPIFIFGRLIPVHKVLQHTSSLIGVLLILYTTWKLPVCSTDNKGINWSYWLLAIMIAFVVFALRTLTDDNIALGNIVVSAITGGLLGLILTPSILSRRFNCK